MSVSPPSTVQSAPRTAEGASTRPAQRSENREADRDAWAANLINEMRRAARTQTPGRSL